MCGKNLQKGKYEIRSSRGKLSTTNGVNHASLDNVCDQPYACILCNEKYEFKSALEAHNESHKLKNPWQCAKCKKIYKNLTKFVKHVKLDHKVSDLRVAKEMLSTNKI